MLNSDVTLDIPLKEEHPVFVPKEKYNAFERFIIPYMNDPRDLRMVYLTLKVTFITLPIAIYLFIDFHWFIAIPYFLFQTLRLLGPFTIMIHSTTHWKIFQEKYKIANGYLDWILGPFFGLAPHTFFAHHVGMHHVENNMDEDLNSTLPYQRDSFKDFMKYFGRFLFLDFFQLIRYFRHGKKTKLLRMVIIGELSFYVIMGLLLMLNWKAALMLIVIPFMLIRLAVMAGNWGEHAFIDAEDPANHFGNSVTNINFKHNTLRFNNGYHTNHHIRPNLHWTELPNDFIKRLDQFAAEKAVIFKNLNSVWVWFYLMRHDYDKLADSFVDVGNHFNSKEEVIAFLKERAKKLPEDKIPKGFYNDNH